MPAELLLRAWAEREPRLVLETVSGVLGLLREPRRELLLLA